MKTMYFDNFDEFEKSQTAGQYEVVSIVKNEKYNTLCADLMTDCKSYKTAIKRFFKSLKDYPMFGGWEEQLLESCENGIWSAKETDENGEYYAGGWHYTVEDNDGSFYICVNTILD